MGQVEKHDRGSRCDTNLVPNKGLIKVSSETTMNVNSRGEQTETKDPNSED